MKWESSQFENYWIFAACIAFFAVMALHAGTILPELGGTCVASASAMSEVHSWLPLAFRTSQGNLFPMSPSIAPAEMGFRFFPYISIWTHGLLIAVFGINGASFIGHTIFPLACFILFILILRRFLPLRWTLSLSFFAFFSFISLPFRDFLAALIQGESWRAIVTLEPLAISEFPMPALSLAAFLGVFYASSLNKRLTPARITVLTVLWALQTQIHIVNAVIGLPYWFLNLATRWRRQNPNAAPQELIRLLLTQGIIAVILILPMVLAYARLSGSGFALLSGASPDFEKFFGPFYLALYFVLPLALMLIVYVVERVDPYEFIFRFRSVYALLAIEMALYLAYTTGLSPLSPTLVFSRIGIFFLHILYFVPVVYFLQRPPRKYSRGVESRGIFPTVRIYLGKIFSEWDQTYLPVIVFFLCVFAISSSLAQTAHFRANDKPAVKAAWEDLKTATAGAPENGAVVLQNSCSNLLLPLSSQQSTLWVNRFINPIPEAEGIERLALYAVIIGWTEDEFVQFMSPGKMQLWHRRDSISITGAAPGFGYWLTMHRATLTPEGLARYQDSVRAAYKNLDVASAAKRYGVRRILTRGEIPKTLTVKLKQETPRGTLYDLAD